jgi:hypothetical protein
MTASAAEIYQAFLDEGSRMIMAGDFAAVARSMVYPQTMETSDGILSYDGPSDMEHAAASFRAFLATMGATDYHRVCDFAEIDAEGTVISGEHTTYVIRGGQFAVPPYRNRMWLRLDEGVWRGAGLAAAVSNRVCTILSPEQLRAAKGVQA